MPTHEDCKKRQNEPYARGLTGAISPHRSSRIGGHLTVRRIFATPAEPDLSRVTADSVTNRERQTRILARVVTAPLCPAERSEIIQRATREVAEL